MYSDDFTRQSFWVGAFESGHCAALLAFRSINLASPSSFKDSWFQFIPEESLLDALADKPRRGFIINNATVDFPYRGGDLLYALIIAGSAMALRIGFDRMLSLTNDSRGVDKLCRAVDGVEVRKYIPVYNVGATFFKFSPDAVRSAILRAPSSILNQVKEARILIGEEKVSYGDNEEAIA
ncbi:hypothetical protein [Microbulbifer taiwanensis]|uniref:Uncharacterized protein n=2 Tax=Microbulbifer taiwanensis TaxID=986746 RepID=A0ABW1YLH1_9GAMM|nr:hypothetical protein [Microbulbifer taiwanensis]